MGRWDAAVAAAGEEPPAGLLAAVAEELAALWSDLAEALRRAHGSWSAQCDNLVVRIVILTRQTAATPWPWIPQPLLANGIYQGILESAGIGCALPGVPELHGHGMHGHGMLARDVPQPGEPLNRAVPAEECPRRRHGVGASAVS